jgi:hypothetical protein
VCKDCEHWRRSEAYKAQGLTFAPCALEPDTVVRDSRVIGGFELQAYVMQDNYECARFTPNEGQSREQI